ncbi:MAG: DUF1194 domain-containing protein [Pseudomonadota bacterium]
MNGTELDRLIYWPVTGRVEVQVRLIWLLSCLMVLLVVPAKAMASENQDIALALAVDVSISVSEEEKDLQRRGYIEAFRSREVIDAIMSGPYGAIAVTYFEWSGAIEPSVVVPWFVIDSEAAAHEFADRLSRSTELRKDTTSISGALLFAQELLNMRRGRARKLILDVSGDGPNNHGIPVEEARDRLVADGIIINGLPIMVNANDANAGFDLSELDSYYRDRVIGGNGAFLISVLSWREFPDSVQRKLVLEISGGRGGTARPKPTLNVQYKKGEP